MADTAIAITAIVVSGVVGPGLTAWWTRDRQRADHQQELRRELRQVLDDAASALERAKRAFDAVGTLYQTGVAADSDAAREAFGRWRTEMVAVRYCEGRIAIRLGADHRVYVAYCSCMKALERQRTFARVYEGGQDAGAAQHERDNANRDYRTARDDYFSAARDLIGTRARAPG